MMQLLISFIFLGVSQSFASGGIGVNQNFFYPNYQYNDCIACSANANLYSQPMYYGSLNSNNIFAGNNYSPWWAQYGTLSYPNFYYPSAWNNYGVRGSSYAGHGTAFGGKPNVYVSAPDGTQLQIKVKTTEPSNLLLTVPSHNENGWDVTIRDNKFIADEIEHDYLFYDIRFDRNDFSNESGFCGNRKFVIEEMLKSLQIAKFKENELKDFYDYWSVKLPRSESYCIFPQFNKENEKAYKLEVTNKGNSKIKMTRLTFVVALKENIKQKSGNKFFTKPINESSYKDKLKEISISSQESIEIREWGVAFLSTDQ